VLRPTNGNGNGNGNAPFYPDPVTHAHDERPTNGLAQGGGPAVNGQRDIL